MRHQLRRFSRLVTGYAEGLSLERLRMHSIVLAAGLWITAVYTIATPGLLDRNGILKGIDFLQFYTAGRLLTQDGARRLYDWDAFVRVLRDAVPAAADVVFVSVYPPQLAAAFGLLGNVSYAAALMAWTLVSIGLYALCVWAVVRHVPELRRSGLSTPVVALAFVPFQQLVVHGQIGTLVLACFTVAWLALRREQWWVVGFALGSVCFKPTFLISAVIAAAASRSVRLVGGVALGVGLQVLAVTFLLGSDVWHGYYEKCIVLLRSPEMFEPKPWQMHNLKGFFRLLLGESGWVVWLWLACVPPVLLAVDWIWRRTKSADVRVAALVLATVLLNPHLYVYDLVVLLVVFGALVRWMMDVAPARAPNVAILLHVLWWIPLLGPFARLTRVQLTPLVIAVLLWQLARSVRGAPEPSTALLRSA